jgi:hypothetical protein
MFGCLISLIITLQKAKERKTDIYIRNNINENAPFNILALLPLIAQHNPSSANFFCTFMIHGPQEKSRCSFFFVFISSMINAIGVDNDKINVKGHLSENVLTLNIINTVFQHLHLLCMLKDMTEVVIS